MQLTQQEQDHQQAQLRRQQQRHRKRGVTFTSNTCAETRIRFRMMNWTRSSQLRYIITLLSIIVSIGSRISLLQHVNGQSSSSSSSDEDSGFNGKDIPMKGDSKCPSLADRYNYFRNGNSNNDTNIWLLPCEETYSDSNNNIPGVDLDVLDMDQLPNHTIVLQLFTSLPAYASDFRNLFSWGVIGYLDEASLEYDITSNFTIPVDLFNYTERRLNPTYDATIVYQTVVATNIKTLDAVWWYQYQFVFYCFYGTAHRKRVGLPITNTDIDTTLTPLNDTSTTNSQPKYKLRTIQQRLNYYLRNGINLINLFQLRESSNHILGISIEDPRYSLTPFEDGPPTIPPTLSPTYYTVPDNNDDENNSNNNTNPWDGSISNNTINGGAPPPPLPNDHDDTNQTVPGRNYNDNNMNENENGPYSSDNLSYRTYTSPINVQAWDWRRFLGLIIFIITTIGTIVLTQLASYRRKEIMKQTIWGNIGTEQGVEALLSTGWKVNNTIMEVYHKDGIGYRDDDSMLLGGYQQTLGISSSETTSVPSQQQQQTYGIGAEITIPQDESMD